MSVLVRWSAGIGVGLMAFGLLGIASPDRLAAPGHLPPNTVLLSTMMQELSAQPGFTDAMMSELEKQSRVGAALLTPELMHRLREMIVGKDWTGLDRFPGWTMREINPTVRVVGHVAGKDSSVEKTATAGGAPSGSPSMQKDFLSYEDLGPYTLDAAHHEDLDQPSTRAGFSDKDLVSTLGAGVTRGDGADARLAPMHAESQRLADVLNRLSLNRLDGVQPMTAKLGDVSSIATPEDLMRALLASGHTVEVYDSRYFANFGHFHYKGEDVMMPFWVNTQILVPGTKRPLLVPVSHAEYEWQVRGPKINASLSFYFGIDGKAEFRVMDQLDQPWVMNRHAHTYTGNDAIEVTRLTGAMVVAYAHLHRARPKMPFGGYYGLGVCQDVVAAIEMKMTGKATLFPNTADGALFSDPRDAEVNALIKALPKDRDGKPVEPERIFGSLPTEDLEGVSIPGLGPDLVAVHQAWTDGTLERARSWKKTAAEIVLFSMGALLLVGAVRKARRLTRE